MAQAVAVTSYTLLELMRRRLVLVFVVIGVLLTTALGLVPVVISAPSGMQRTVNLLNSLSSSVGLVVTACAYAVGATVINHDLESGAAVGILSKPVSRLEYAVGKLAAAVIMLLAINVLFFAGVMILVAINGGVGDFTNDLVWEFAAQAGNVVLLMIVVMALTVYLNNIVSVVLAFVFSFVSGIVATVHTLIQNHVITNSILQGIGNVLYWVFPHRLVSNLTKDVTKIAYQLNPPPTEGGGRGFRVNLALNSLPGASSESEIIFWAVYLLALILLLYLALRAKQV